MGKLKNIETSIGYCEDDGIAFVSSNERKWISKIIKYKSRYQDEVTILALPEDNGGFIYAKIPQKWVALRPPRKINLTDEQRAIRREQFMIRRKAKSADT